MRLFSDVSTHIDDPWLRRAFTLAERGRGTTAPNPIVGCVIVSDGVVVGEGYHERAGEPHAEVVALRHAGEAARGATAYVTLEPCNHHGRTPPCTEALLDAGIARVVIGMTDPNPQVGGGGAAMLRDAGVDVTLAADARPFEEQNESWIAFARTGRPFVRVKLALSLDGHPALAPGRRSAITGASGAEVTRRLRSQADAVLVGASTARVDDPALTARQSDGTLLGRQPQRVILARTDLPPASSRVFTDRVAPTLVLVPAELAARARDTVSDVVEIVEFDAEEGIGSALRVLGARGVVDLLVEPGPHLFTSLWEGKLVDELVTVHAGGMAGTAAPGLFLGHPDVTGPPADVLAHRAVPVEAGIVGDVCVTVWRPARPEHHRDGEVHRASQPSTAPRR